MEHPPHRRELKLSGANVLVLLVVEYCVSIVLPVY